MSSFILPSNIHANLKCQALFYLAIFMPISNIKFIFTTKCCLFGNVKFSDKLGLSSLFSQQNVAYLVMSSFILKSANAQIQRVVNLLFLAKKALTFKNLFKINNLQLCS